MLKVIEIENIKGIQLKRFELNIFPNKPSLLVAPNGFGKSSLATAFNLMNRERIVLSEEDFYEENLANAPRIFIEYTKLDGTQANLEATNNANTISGEFDYFVINNQTKPKGIGSRYGTATARLEIKDIILIDKIPANVSFNYSYRDTKTRFGKNSKVLPNVTDLLSNLKLVEKLSGHYDNFKKAKGKIILKKIDAIIAEINEQTGKKEVLTEWITTNRLNDLQQINYLKTIGNLINEFDIYDSETKSYLAAIQLIWQYNEDIKNFKKAYDFNNYRLDKQRFDETLETFNCTWRNIRSSETGGKLVVKFPKATNISNGQRDILTFISMLFKAKRKLNKSANILIIDEVFDYLDDANLIAAQYYITEMIDEYKKEGKNLYPLILTHLNPNYFKYFVFSKQKVYYLDKSDAEVNEGIKKLLRNRDKQTIKDDVSKYLLHFTTCHIDKRKEFRELGIPELWGEKDNFYQFLFNEVDKYLSGRPFCPFAVCGGVRVKIEKIAYEKLQSDLAQDTFLQTHKTISKLEKAEEMGVYSPESHYLLGVIYNEGMHWRNNQDNVSPIASKLENLTIKKLIRDVFD